jgi:hypothetical protein
VIVGTRQRASVAVERLRPRSRTGIRTAARGVPGRFNQAVTTDAIALTPRIAPTRRNVIRAVSLVKYMFDLLPIRSFVRRRSFLLPLAL